MRRILPTAISLLALAAAAATPVRFSLVRSDSGDAAGDDETGLFSLDEATLRLACLEEAPDRPAEGAPNVAILCHGFAGRKESPLFDAVSKALRAKGFVVARFDFNGHGESEGAFGRMTVSNEVLDVGTVVDYYRNVRGARVALVGHSQGGVVAALAAAKLGEDAVEALALLAPAGVLRDDALRGLLFGTRYDPLDPPETVPVGDTGLAVGRDYVLGAQETDAYAEIARYRGPLVVVHGQADTVVPWTYGERFVNASAGKGELVIVRPADHAFREWEETVGGVVANFLAESFGLTEEAEAPAPQETPAESAEVAAPVAQEETHAESAEVAETPVAREESHAESAENAAAPVAEPTAAGTVTPVDLPPDIRNDMRTFLDTLGSQSAETPVPPAPVPEVSVPEAPAPEVPAPEAPVPEAPAAEVAEAPAPETPAPQKEPEQEPVVTPMFDRLVATYAEHNGLEVAIARDVLADNAKAGGLSCEAYAKKVLDEAGVTVDEAGNLADKPADGDAVPAVRGDEVAASEPVAAEPPAAVPPPAAQGPQTIADFVAAYPPQPVDAKSSVINILVAPNGFTWQGLEVEKEDLIDRLRIFGMSIPEAHVRISTYPDVPFETMKDIVTAVRDAGFAHLSVSMPSVPVPPAAP